MLDKLLLDKTDFVDYRDLSDNYDTNRLDQSIRESQIDELLAFVGDELYLIMQNDYTVLGKTWATQKYNDLWNGKDYTTGNKTIRYHGLQPAISLYAYSRLLDNASLSLTRTGAVQFTEEDVSDPAEQAQIATKVRSAKAQALVYLARAKKFLDANTTDYPEFQTKDSEVQNKSSLTMFKI